MEPGCLIPHSQGPFNIPYPEPNQYFSTWKKIFQYDTIVSLLKVSTIGSF